MTEFNDRRRQQLRREGACSQCGSFSQKTAQGTNLGGGATRATSCADCGRIHSIVDLEPGELSLEARRQIKANGWPSKKGRRK